MDGDATAMVLPATTTMVLGRRTCYYTLPAVLQAAAAVLLRAAAVSLNCLVDAGISMCLRR